MTKHLKIAELQSALVVGAGGGIGFALVECLLKRNAKLKVYATYRSLRSPNNLNQLQQEFPSRLIIYKVSLTEEGDIEELARNISRQSDSLCLVVNTVGILHDAEQQPEKRLADIDPKAMLRAFEVNSVATLLLAKHLQPLLKNRRPAAFVALSARVGSIGDNRSGGWYSYRMTKAALNMAIKNIALEFARFRCHTLVLALHPGTTTTKLSEPFTSRSNYQLHTANETAENLIEVIAAKALADSGKFFDWRGEEVAW